MIDLLWASMAADAALRFKVRVVGHPRPDRTVDDSRERITVEA